MLALEILTEDEIKEINKSKFFWSDLFQEVSNDAHDHPRVKELKDHNWKTLDELYEILMSILDEVNEKKAIKMMEEMNPIWLNTEKCRKCGTGETKLMIDHIKHIKYYEPCSSCSFVKVARPSKKERNPCCPSCGTALIPGPEKRYETSVDHGFNPNAAWLPLRPTWMCPKKKCIIHQAEGYYGYEGSWYTRKFGDIPNGCHSARFTISEEIEKKQAKDIEKRKVGQC